mmetsp:Transcript_12528/g.28267  ORF Transcript_12528/g.28267 Transcript_12528/m.28267 type:complete len:116 (-) Transcript_12528:67-414(-)
MAEGGVWAGRAGATVGAGNLTRHSRDALKDPGFEAHPAGSAFHASAAGVATGTRYEVVSKTHSSPFLSTSPFACESDRWRQSVEHLGKGKNHNPRLNAMLLQDGELFEAIRHVGK